MFSKWLLKQPKISTLSKTTSALYSWVRGPVSSIMGINHSTHLSNTVWNVGIQESEQKISQQWGLVSQHCTCHPSHLSQGQVCAQHLQTQLDKMTMLPVRNIHNS